ncbi:MAG: peptidylprolyl isomerase [Betaproteobacteria bacterium]
MKSFAMHVAAALGLGCALSFATLALAQAPAFKAAAPAITAPLGSSNPTTEVPLDRVVAVVNDEAITQYDINDSRTKTIRQLTEAKVPLPPKDVLDKQVLERLINERALMQFAKESGIKVDDTLVERTILRVQQENKLTPEQFRQLLDKEKMSYASYREDIRRELALQRLRDREVDKNVFVTEAEVDNYLATAATQSGGENEYLLSHVLVRVPEEARPELIEQRRLRAEEALAQIKSGTDFGQIAASYSDADNALTGGDLGWRTAARLPTIFVEAVRSMKKGDVSAVIRSPAGFHIVKLMDQRNRNAPTVVEQTHARHILVRANENVSDAEAHAKIDRIRERIAGGAKFEDQAKVNSDDASSAKGGDLGWLSPGETVPAFEKAMASLKVDEVSEPIRTPFGWHLIEVMGRRQQDVSKDRQRAQARQAITQRKSEELFQEFIRQTRDRAYVEYKADER